LVETLKLIGYQGTRGSYVLSAVLRCAKVDRAIFERNKSLADELLAQQTPPG